MLEKKQAFIHESALKEKQAFIHESTLKEKQVLIHMDKELYHDEP